MQFCALKPDRDIADAFNIASFIMACQILDCGVRNLDCDMQKLTTRKSQITNYGYLNFSLR